MSTFNKFSPETQSKTKFYDGQRYELIGTEPYTRVDGSETTLSVWRSECPVCGEPFEVRTPKRVRKFEPNRRIVRGKQVGAAS